jgi:hypothetical protein
LLNAHMKLCLFKDKYTQTNLSSAITYRFWPKVAVELTQKLRKDQVRVQIHVRSCRREVEKGAWGWDGSPIQCNLAKPWSISMLTVTCLSVMVCITWFRLSIRPSSSNASTTWAAQLHCGQLSFQFTGHIKETKKGGKAEQAG